MYTEDYVGTKEYKKLIKSFVNKVKFSCDFVDNVCVNVREEKIPTGECSKSIPCCCGHCFSSGGFLSIDRKSNLWRKHYKNLFLEGVGFYRKNSGCVLSREYRSKICNTFICSTLLSKMAKVEREEYHHENGKLCKKMCKEYYE